MNFTRPMVFSLLLVVAAPFAAANESAATDSIVEVARQAGSFETLITALDAAGLTATLAEQGPFTVFAPTDEAFAALPEGTLESLLADPDALTAVLTYHVVPGKATSGDVAGLDSVTTLQGGVLPISVGEQVEVGEATVVQADVAASNGVIHVIDTVLLP